MSFLKKCLGAPLAFPLILLLLCIASYGLLIPWLGYYGDDLSMGWLAYKTHQLNVFFRGNRPLWGSYYEITSKIVGPAAWHWQVYALIWRWLSALAFGWLLRLLGPQSKMMAGMAAMLFAVYPGFLMSSEAMTFSVHYVQLTIWLASLIASVYSLRRPHQARRWILLASAGAVFNLALSEFFFFLELVRPAILWLERSRQAGDWRKQFLPALRAELPYGIIFTGVALARIFNLAGMNSAHSLTLLDELKQNPGAALLDLGTQMASDLGGAVLASFGNILNLPNLEERPQLYLLGLAGLILASSIAIYAYWHTLAEENSSSTALDRLRWAYFGVGIVGLGLAGIPIWIARMPAAQDASSTRLNLPFMPGACLLLVALTGLIFRPRVQKGILAVIVAGSVAFQVLTGVGFTRQQTLQKNFLWQLAVRMPALQPATLLVGNPRFLPFNGENANSALINWMYTPHPSQAGLNYYLYQNPNRIQSILDQFQSQPVLQDHLIGTFRGERLVAIDFRPPGCLRVLDPDLDPLNLRLTPEQRRAAALSDLSAIQAAPPGASLPEPPAEIFGKERQPQNWCTRLARASLAAQLKDWNQVVQIGETFFSDRPLPVDFMERVVFIEAFAQQGNWQQVEKWLPPEIENELALLVCRLKQRLNETTPASPERSRALERFTCAQD